MVNRFTLTMVLGTIVLGLTACGELAPPPKQAEEPAAESSKAAPVPEGPYYEVTKDELTTHTGFTSRNIKIMGVKLGDSTSEMEKAFGKPTRAPSVLDKEYLSFYQDN